MINQLLYQKKSRPIFKKHANISIYGNYKSIQKYFSWKEYFQMQYLSYSQLRILA